MRLFVKGFRRNKNGATLRLHRIIVFELVEVELDFVAKLCGLVDTVDDSLVVDDL